MTTTYEAAGGDAGLLRLAEAWHARVLADEVVAHASSNGYRSDHSVRLAPTGPRRSAGRRRTPSLRRRDRGRAAAQRERRALEMNQRAIACFDEALVDAGLAANEPLRAALHRYFAWTTTATMARYHASAAEVPEGLSISRWSWEGPTA